MLETRGLAGASTSVRVYKLDGLPAAYDNGLLVVSPSENFYRVWEGGRHSFRKVDDGAALECEANDVGSGYANPVARFRVERGPR